MKIGKFIILIITIGIWGCQANPDNLNYEENYLKGLALSVKKDKPVFIHFTCDGCVGYNEFEDYFMRSSEIQNQLNGEFVTIQLYVDDRKKIEVSDTLNLHKIDFSAAGKERIKKARTIGDINAAIEIDLFGQYTQPLYVIIDAKQNILVEPFGYTAKNRKLFMKKLRDGIKI